MPRNHRGGKVSPRLTYAHGERGIEYLFANGGTDFAPMIEADRRDQCQGHDAAVEDRLRRPRERRDLDGDELLPSHRPAAARHVPRQCRTANGINALIDAARDRCRSPSPPAHADHRSGFKGSRDTGIHWQQECSIQAGMVREFANGITSCAMPSNLESRIDRRDRGGDDRALRPVYLTCRAK